MKKEIYLKRDISDGIHTNTSRVPQINKKINLDKLAINDLEQKNPLNSNEKNIVQKVLQKKENNIPENKKDFLDYNKDGIPDEKNIVDLNIKIKELCIKKKKKQKNKIKGKELERELEREV